MVLCSSLCGRLWIPRSCDFSCPTAVSVRVPHGSSSNSTQETVTTNAAEACSPENCDYKFCWSMLPRKLPSTNAVETHSPGNCRPPLLQKHAPQKTVATNAAEACSIGNYDHQCCWNTLPRKLWPPMLQSMLPSHCGADHMVPITECLLCN